MIRNMTDQPGQVLIRTGVVGIRMRNARMIDDSRPELAIKNLFKPWPSARSAVRAGN